LIRVVTIVGADDARRLEALWTGYMASCGEQCSEKCIGTGPARNYCSDEETWLERFVIIW
jgi:hypothetical protein